VKLAQPRSVDLEDLDRHMTEVMNEAAIEHSGRSMLQQQAYHVVLPGGGRRRHPLSWRKPMSRFGQDQLRGIMRGFNGVAAILCRPTKFDPDDPNRTGKGLLLIGVTGLDVRRHALLVELDDGSLVPALTTGTGVPERWFLEVEATLPWRPKTVFRTVADDRR